MNDLEINKLIHEKVMGKCWHMADRDAFFGKGWNLCIFCKELIQPNPSYTTSWADYGPMLAWAQGELWWDDFITYMTSFFVQEPTVDDIMGSVSMLLNPLRGSIAIAEFVEARPQYFKGEKE